MGWILTLGIVIVLFLQSLGDWLITPMQLFSQLGTETFFLVIMPAFLWCVDAAWGLRAGIALMVSGSLNHALKIVFLGPRPYWFDARVRPLSVETSLGAPSGHAQNAMAVWGTLAAQVRKRWAWAAALALIFLIGLSRLYLGMHFPHDVLVGWTAGALILAGLIQGEKRLGPWMKRSSAATLTLTALGVSLGMILLNAALVWAVNDWTVPPEWITLAARAPGAKEFDPLSLTGAVSTAATFWGLAAGGALLWGRGWYDARGSGRQLAARYLLGLMGLLAIYIGLDSLFPDGASLIALIFRYVRYALLGLWAAFLAPELFIRMGLAKRAQPGKDAPSNDAR